MCLSPSPRRGFQQSRVNLIPPGRGPRAASRVPCRQSGLNPGFTEQFAIRNADDGKQKPIISPPLANLSPI